MALQLTDYLESNILLSNTQHGFRSYLSTQTALPTLTNKSYENIDTKKVSLLALCDLSKAVVSVSHDMLIRKCINLNMDPVWFNNNLSKRTQSVRMGTYMSSKCDVTYGVPQGSVLGPICQRSLTLYQRLSYYSISR